LGKTPNIIEQRPKVFREDFREAMITIEYILKEIKKHKPF